MNRVSGAIKSIPFIAAGMFFVLGVVFLFYFRQAPIKDFGNYYYGSRLLADGGFSDTVYKDLHFFNAQIALSGQKNFFENYIPVPPFSAVFYAPFVVFNSGIAKLLFNLLSLCLFCVAFYRLLFFVEIKSYGALLLPLVFAQPLLNNLMQGQAYLLVLALISEIYVLTQNGKVILPSFYLSLCIVLKLFPAFILLYFILRKNYRMVGYTVVNSLLLLLFTLIFIGPSTVGFYFEKVLPRLMNNDVVGTYHAANQSLYSFLLNLFSADALNNPHPLFNFPYLVPVIEALLTACLLFHLYLRRQSNPLKLFGLVCLALLLVNRYNPSYSLILILPPAISLFNGEKLKQRQIAALCVLAFALFFKIPNVAESWQWLKFGRLLALCLLFLLIVEKPEVTVNYSHLAMIALPLLAFRIFMFSIVPLNYFSIQNSIGILYDISLKNNSLSLMSTLGERDTTETIDLPGVARYSNELKLVGNKIMYNNRVICQSSDNKKNPFVYNDTSVVFMSDLNQACGFYKLRFIPIKK